MPDDVPQLLTLMQVATALCVSPHTVRSWTKKGRLRPVRLCRRLLFHPVEIERFLDSAALPTREEVSTQ
jgi:predicted site-specific integrase-resolvase